MTHSETLKAEGVTVQFGGLTALENVSLTVEPGVILGLIGPNGAGKTTLVNVLSGFQAPSHGRVWLAAEEITRWSPSRRSRSGIVRTFQGARLFPNLSVIENVLIGALTKAEPREEAESRAWLALDRFDLSKEANLPAGSLPYGKERMLSLARAIVAKPHFLLIDEPAAGLNDIEVKHLAEILADLSGEYGFGMLLIEHHMDLVMAVCDEVQVLVKGSTLCRGTSAAVQQDPSVIEAYLGV